MKALIQRVNNASVSVGGDKISEIDRGLLVMIGIKDGDDDQDINYVVDKTVNMRIFETEDKKLDHSVTDINGEILVVSQFTLYGECNKGRRPDFSGAAPADYAKNIYEKTVQAFKNKGLTIKEGKFQSYMMISLTNDGPVTIMLESRSK